MKTALLLLLVSFPPILSHAAEVAATPVGSPSATGTTTAKPAEKPSAAVAGKTNVAPAITSGTYTEHDTFLEFQKSQAKKGFPQSQYIMALRYLSGNGVPKDEAKARELLAAAAKQGHVKSREKLLELKRIDKGT
jgi:TPR repeat protein